MIGFYPIYMNNYKSMIHLRDRLFKVHDRLHQAAASCHRPVEAIQLLAVSKTHPATSIRALYAAGQYCFGENYVQEALAKQTELADLDIEWHFIGPVQSNKTQAIAQHFDWVHSVDREKIAIRLNDHRGSELPPLNVCLQLNIDNEDTKSGVQPGQLIGLARQVMNLPHLCLRGLMAIPAPHTDYRAQLQAFQQVASEMERLNTALNCPTLDTLSMGMSGDLEAAVAAGSTLVRIGTDIFGVRETRDGR